MAKTIIDIDEDLLAESMAATHSRTKKEAVNRALELSVKDDREKRMQALREMQQMARDGLLDFSEVESE